MNALLFIALVVVVEMYFSDSKCVQRSRYPPRTVQITHPSTTQNIVTSVTTTITTALLTVVTASASQTSTSLFTTPTPTTIISTPTTATVSTTTVTTVANTFASISTTTKTTTTTTILVGCPSGWSFYLNKCYYLGTNKLSYYDATGYCNSNGAMLMKINDIDEFNYAFSMCNACTIFIGLIAYSQNTFTWQDGTDIIDNSFWASGQPDSTSNLANRCARLNTFTNPGINVADCTAIDYFLCQKLVSLMGK